MTRNRRTRVKFCGLSRQEDIRLAAGLGVDAIGLVFCPGSPRHLELERARQLAATVPAFVSLVALFLDPDAELVHEVLRRVRPDLLQFHGSEPASFCDSFERRYLKAIAMKDADPAAQIAAYPGACAYLVDSHAPGQRGGSGETFDWRQLPGGDSMILAGGLAPDNVAAAIRLARPYGVDVSSGIESAPGIKSAAKMADFLRGVDAADSDRQTGSA